MNSEDFLKICKALADPNRLQIIMMIADQEKCACKLLEHFNISQPTLSHHIRVLSENKLIHTRHVGKWSHYSLNTDTMEEVENLINILKESGLASLKNEDKPQCPECQ